MKNKWVVFIVLAVLIGLSSILFVNCGGITHPAEQNNTPVTKNWELVGDAGFSAGNAETLSLFTYRGTPYVAYQDRANSNQATVMKFNGSTWESVGIPDFSLGGAAYISLAVYNGTPYVAYQDDYNYGTGKDLVENRATVMKFNGISWEVVGDPAFSAGVAVSTVLFIDNGTPFVAYSDSVNDSKATVMKFNGSTWESVGTPGFSSGGASSFSLAGYNGTPYVAYSDSANSNKATVMKFNGSMWESVGTPGFSANEISHQSQSLSIYNGTPYLAYADLVLTNVGLLPKPEYVPKATVMKFNGASWECVGSPDFVQTEQIEVVSLQVYNGIPYIAYKETAVGASMGRASVMKFNGTNWEYVGGQGFSTHAASGILLFITEQGIPYVAYTDYDNGHKATVMRYIEQ